MHVVHMNRSVEFFVLVPYIPPFPTTTTLSFLPTSICRQDLEKLLRRNRKKATEAEAWMTQGMGTRKRARVALCGPALAGKTTLCHRIQRHERRLRRVFTTKCTNDDESAPASDTASSFGVAERCADLVVGDPKALLRIYDFQRGSEVYLLEHLTRAATALPDIVVLVLPLKLLGCALEKEAEIRERCTCMLRHWFAMLAGVIARSSASATTTSQQLREDERGCSSASRVPVQVVFSFIDCVGTAQRSVLKSELKKATLETSEEYEQLLICKERILFLDCRKSSEPGMTALRNALAATALTRLKATACQMPQMVDKMRSWLTAAPCRGVDINVLAKKIVRDHMPTYPDVAKAEDAAKESLR